MLTVSVAVGVSGLLLMTAGTCFAQCPEDTCNTDCTRNPESSHWNTWYAFGWNWPESIFPIDYYINKDGADHCIGNEFLTVQRSLARWEELMTAYWCGCYQGTTSARSTAHNTSPSWDSLNVVSWEDMGGSSPLKLGRAAYWYISNLIQEGDISLNNNAAVSWSALVVDSCYADTTFDLESVVTHEFGHWMSMEHSCDVLATMYCWTSKNETHKRTPNECDLLGMQWNYMQYVGQPKLQPGCWPSDIGSWVTSNPVLGDIGRDGIEDVVIVGNDGKVHVLSGRGEELSGWPQDVGDVEGSPALGDLDNDGWLEIAVGSLNDSVYVFNHNGSRAAGWPRGTGDDVKSTPAIADINQDGRLDVICASTDSCVYAWWGCGNPMQGWPVKTGGDIPLAGPALADLDGDDSLDVVISGYDNKVYALSPHGFDVSGWPVFTGEKVYERVAIGDIDDDDEFEVVATAVSDSAYAWNADGSRCSGWPIYVPGSIGYSAPSLGDIDNDGIAEILFGSDSDSVYAFNGNGGRVPGWPVYVDGKVRGSVLIVDVNADGAYDAVAATDDSKIYAFHGNGATMNSHWPATFDGGYERTPVIGDCNGDGELDIVAGSGGSKVYAYCLGSAVTDNSYEWRMYGNDFNRTSRYGFAPDPPTPLRFIDAIADFTHWERWGVGASITLSTMSYSAPTSMGVTGSGTPGDFASAYSEFITVDFSRPYTIKFAFAYDDFFSSTWIVFGHARFKLDNPFSPVLLDVAGDWSTLVPVGLPFNSYTPPMAYAEYEIQVDPATSHIELIVNDVPVGGATYGPGVVPSNRMWLSDDPGSSEFLTGWYDDFEVHGYLPVVSVRPQRPAAPAAVNALYQSYPNPMNPMATIRYSVRETGRVTIRIFDVAGRVMRELVDEVKQASATPYSVIWDGRDEAGRRVASGVYFYRMDAKNFASSKKIVVLQ